MGVWLNGFHDTTNIWVNGSIFATNSSDLWNGPWDPASAPYAAGPWGSLLDALRPPPHSPTWKLRKLKASWEETGCSQCRARQITKKRLPFLQNSCVRKQCRKPWKSYVKDFLLPKVWCHQGLDWVRTCVKVKPPWPKDLLPTSGTSTQNLRFKRIEQFTLDSQFKY